MRMKNLQEYVNCTKRIMPTSRHTIYNTKWRRLLAPTQLSIQGQWLYNVNLSISHVLVLGTAYWSCLATHLPQRRQCLLRNGFRIIQETQKFSSSNFHCSKSSAMIALCWCRLPSLGIYPGSSTIEIIKKNEVNP